MRKTWRFNGLNSLQYQLLNTIERKLYTKLTVDLLEELSKKSQKQKKKRVYDNYAGSFVTVTCDYWTNRGVTNVVEFLSDDDKWSILSR